MNYTREEIAAGIKRFKRWFHNIDLHGVLTNPANPSYPETRWQLIKPYVPQDLTGKTVLDVGCNAGYFSIKMKQRGASVVGVDWYVEGIEQAKFVADVLGLEIEYICQNIYEFVINSTKTFDYVLLLGVFYHLRYPLLILDYLARITNEKLYFQTIITDASAKRDLVIPENLTGANYDLFHDPDFPKMCFVEHNLDGAYNNWFVCNTSGICAVLRSSGFTNIIRAGGDCFVCGPPDRDARPKISHTLAELRKVPMVCQN